MCIRDRLKYSKPILVSNKNMFLTYDLGGKGYEVNSLDKQASKLGKSEAKCKLAAAVLLTAPGEPYIYYGEELGIYGTKEKADEYVRSPMLWGCLLYTSRCV